MLQKNISEEHSFFSKHKSIVFKVFGIITFLFFFGLIPTLFGQSAYTKLQRPNELSEFHKVSQLIVCQCGCNFLLGVCPHIECPWSIPLRRFIENRIHKKENAETIVRKLELGYGEQLRDDPFIKEWLKDPRLAEHAEKIIAGYGHKVRGYASSNTQILLGLVFVTLLLAIFLYWWRKNNRLVEKREEKGKNIEKSQKL